MTTLVQFVVTGVAAGAIYALLALGLVVINRASGVFNFAQGAFAVMAGFQFATLVEDRGWPVPIAFAVVLLGAAAVGVLVYWLVMRPLRDASQLTRVIGTLAVLLIFVGIATVKYGANSVLVTPYLPEGVVEYRGVAIDYASILLTVIACVMTLGLWAIARFSLVGLVVRGVAENPRATAANGWSPDLVSSVAWAFGTALGAAAGMLIAPVTGVTTSSMTLLLVAAFAAALVGGFTSFPLTLAGALFIGVGQAEISNYVTQPGASEAFPFLAIVVFMVVLGRGLPIRGHLMERAAELGSGFASRWVVIPGTVVAAALLATAFSTDLTLAIATSLAFATILLSIVLLTGYGGQLSLAQMAFAGMGALITGRLIESQGWAFAPAALVGVLATIPIGLAFAVPSLRTRGITLAMVTFGLGAAVSSLIFGNPEYTGGSTGTTVGPQTLLGWEIGSDAHPERYALLTFAAFVLCAIVVANVRRSRVGRRLIAVRSNERAAAARGVNVYATKLYAFGVSAAIAALGGILVAFQFETIEYGQFNAFNSVLLVGHAVIGGVGFVAGALMGAPLAPGGLGAWGLGQLGDGVVKYLPLIGGVTLLVVLVLNPNGLQSSIGRLLRASRRRSVRKSIARHDELPSVHDVSRVRPATLTIEDLAVHFGGVKAADGVSLTLRPGTVTGLIGPNGAGKSTVIDAVTGMVPLTRGSVRLDGEPIERWAPHRRARAGISRSFQSLELFEGVTVRENILSASEEIDGLSYLTSLLWPRKPQFTQAAIAAIREFDLERDLDRTPAELSYGRRRLVAIAIAVASEPSVLLLDEPVAGLDDDEAAEFAHLVRGLAETWGIAILLVEHDMSFVMTTCDELVAIDFGRQIRAGSPTSVTGDPRVIAAYLGEPDVAEQAPPGPAMHGARATVEARDPS